MSFVLKSAATLRDLKAMLDRVQLKHLDLPLEFVQIDRGGVFTLQHIGRVAIDADVVDGDKGAFFITADKVPTRAVILLAADAEFEIARINRASMALTALQEPQP